MLCRTSATGYLVRQAVIGALAVRPLARAMNPVRGIICLTGPVRPLWPARPPAVARTSACCDPRGRPSRRCSTTPLCWTRWCRSGRASCITRCRTCAAWPCGSCPSCTAGWTAPRPPSRMHPPCSWYADAVSPRMCTHPHLADHPACEASWPMPGAGSGAAGQRSRRRRPLRRHAGTRRHRILCIIKGPAERGRGRGRGEGAEGWGNRASGSSIAAILKHLGAKASSEPAHPHPCRRSSSGLCQSRHPRLVVVGERALGPGLLRGAVPTRTRRHPRDRCLAWTHWSHAPHPHPHPTATSIHRPPSGPRPRSIRRPSALRRTRPAPCSPPRGVHRSPSYVGPRGTSPAAPGRGLRS